MCNSSKSQMLSQNSPLGLVFTPQSPLSNKLITSIILLRAQLARLIFSAPTITLFAQIATHGDQQMISQLVCPRRQDRRLIAIVSNRD